MQEMNENCKIVDGKKVTAAVVIINKVGDILGCKVTGKNTYDFPKGCVDEDECDIDGAFRELYEETCIRVMAPESYDNIVDCGVYPHNRGKNIHIFLWRIESFPDLSALECVSCFKRNGKMIPEVNGYKIISKTERNLFNRILQDKFQMIDKTNEAINENR